MFILSQLYTYSLYNHMHHFQLSIQLSITLQSGPSLVEPQGHEQPAHFGFTRPDEGPHLLLGLFLVGRRRRGWLGSYMKCQAESMAR